MMRQYLCLLLLAFLCLGLNAQNSPRLQLFDLPDVRFKSIDAPAEGFESYVLFVKQPFDHNNPSAGHFYQKVYLNHKGFDRHTVICTEGYAAPRNRMYEVTSILDANQVTVEHRYFGESVRDDADWKYLTIEQATADLHKIRMLLGEIYKEKWVSTGISKGGQTTIAYRYFYPDDVAVSVPYVAPLNNAFEDKRIYKFLETVGNKECRKAIENYQIELLKRKEEIMPMLRWYTKGAKEEFTYHSLEEAFELGVLEYSFSFWQWGSDCAEIPEDNKETEELLEHFIDVVGTSFYSDKDVDFYGPHYYQASAQFGYYGFDTKPFKKHLDVLPKKPHASFEPDKMKIKYDPTYNKKVSQWLEEKGNQFIHIYGELDTWSATAVEAPGKELDALYFMMEGKHHGNARIRNLSKTEQELIVKKLKEWLR